MVEFGKDIAFVQADLIPFRAQIGISRKIKVKAVAHRYAVEIGCFFGALVQASKCGFAVLADIGL